MLRFADVTAAAERIAGRVLRTPALPSEAVSHATGAEVVLKLDNLQVTGAFKERGAANRLALLTDAERERGVIAMSAGNHAQAVARHARLSNVGATIVMPKFTPATKVTRTAPWGANVVLHGETLAEAAAHAEVLAAERGLVFVHPYNDVDVMAGQGTAGAGAAAGRARSRCDGDSGRWRWFAGRMRYRGAGDEAGHSGIRRRGRSVFRDGAAARGRHGLGRWSDYRRGHRGARCR